MSLGRLRIRAHGVLAIAGLALMLAVMGYPATSRAAGTCDRSCLEGMVNRYLKALVAHDPSKAPLAANVKYTENGQRLAPGKGLWATASADATYRLYAADTTDEQVGFLGVMKEDGKPIFIALRLTVEKGKISEIETVVARNNERLFHPGGLIRPKPIFLKTLKPSERSSRSEMIRIANSYFRGLDEENSGKNVPFADKCQRIENGVTTANSTDPKATAMRKMGCKAQFDTGFSVIVTDVRDRRFPVVDEERGLVLSFVFFDHAGRITHATLKDGTPMTISAPYNHPFTWEIAELFKIENGKIRQIEAVLVASPYRMKSGW